jgi:K+-transporting ATPase KdpF subunit
MNATILLVSESTFEMNNSTGYVIGALIAFIILIYLIYSLVKPEKF